MAGGYAAGAGRRVRVEHESERLLERPRIAFIGRGIRRFVEKGGGLSGLAGVERDAAEHDQAPGRELMIESVADHEAAGEQRRGLIGLALCPQRRAERDVDPRLRVMGRLRGSLRERRGQSLELRCLTAQRTEEHSPAVDRDHDRPHDLRGANELVEGRHEDAPLLHHLLGIGAGLTDRDRVGQLRRAGVSRAAAPRGLRRLLPRSELLLRKLHGEQPLRIRRREQERLLVRCDRLAQIAEFVVALADECAGGDGVDPPLSTDPQARLVLVAGDVEGT